MLRAQPARLLATDKSGPGPRLVMLGRADTTIGSTSDCTLRLTAVGVGEKHARIRCVRGRYYLRDFRRGRGTRVNGHGVRRRIRLNHGDRISFGEALPYRFLDPDMRKRLRNRRIIRASALAAVLATAVGAHAAGWDGGALSPVAIAQAFDSAALNLERLHARAQPRSGHATSSAATKPNRESAPAPVGANEARLAAAAPAKVKAAVGPGATPAPSPAATPGGSQWLEQLNRYRSMAGVPALQEDRKLSAAIAAHAHYLILNYAKQIEDGDPIGNGGHDEDPSKSGFTAAGRAASFNSQLGWGCGGKADAPAQISQWIAGPFNRFAMLDPSITEVGFGEAHAKGCWVAGLRLPPEREEVKAYAHAIEFPPAGSTVSLAWNGFEWPNPLAGCPGYTVPAGLPITLQLGRLVPTRLGVHKLMRDGQPISSCAFDSHSYQNPASDEREYARWELRSSGAVVIIPRAPLQAGSKYTISITADGRPYTWSFNVSH